MFHQILGDLGLLLHKRRPKLPSLVAVLLESVLAKLALHLIPYSWLGMLSDGC